jgi:hypothetical protein
MNYTREPFIEHFLSSFAPPLSLSLSLSRRAWNNKHNYDCVWSSSFHPPAGTRSCSGARRKKEVSNKNINSNNCYETTTTRVVASLFLESFSDVCIYDCCIFVYHILFSSVYMSTRQVSWLTITIYICVCIYINVQRFPQPWRKVRRGQWGWWWWWWSSSSFFILLYMTCVMRSLSKKERSGGKADGNGDFRPSFSYRMLNQMQRLKYDRKSHTHVLA